MGCRTFATFVAPLVPAGSSDLCWSFLLLVLAVSAALASAFAFAFCPCLCLAVFAVPVSVPVPVLCVSSALAPLGYVTREQEKK